MSISTILETSALVKDNRTMEQVFIKATEEVGEVAEQVGALSGTYKDGTVKELTKEIADAIIALVDLAYIVNGKQTMLTDVALGLAIESKLDKWSQIKISRGEFDV